jgi:hypothetical protein
VKKKISAQKLFKNVIKIGLLSGVLSIAHFYAFDSILNKNGRSYSSFFIEKKLFYQLKTEFLKLVHSIPRVTRQLEKKSPNFSRNSPKSCQVKMAKISTTNLNLKTQNTYIKPLL